MFSVEFYLWNQSVVLCCVNDGGVQEIVIPRYFRGIAGKDHKTVTLRPLSSLVMFRVE